MTTESPANTRSPTARIWLFGSAIASLIALLVFWPGCGRYPAVSTKEALVATKLLYSACNTRNASLLDEVDRRVEKLSTDGKMPRNEREAFARIIALGRKDDWKKAEDEAFQMCRDQVGQGR